MQSMQYIYWLTVVKKFLAIVSVILLLLLTWSDQILDNRVWLVCVCVCFSPCCIVSRFLLPPLNFVKCCSALFYQYCGCKLSSGKVLTSNGVLSLIDWCDFCITFIYTVLQGWRSIAKTSMCSWKLFKSKKDIKI